MNKLMVAVVAGAVALGAQAGTFLDSLNADSRKVDSSPYATGGDHILKVSDIEYIHVFTNTAATGKFTPTQDLNARILVVGGGGSGSGTYGNHATGGGAGGFVEVRQALAANTAVSVTVGKGGDGTVFYMGSNRGADSKFGSLTASGGNGGNHSQAQNGGTSGAPTAFVGGQQNYGGGGGAGGPGLSGSPAVNIGRAGGYGGQGGPGLSSDILGYDQWFAAGGNGGATGYTIDAPPSCGIGGISLYSGRGDGVTSVKDGMMGTGSGGGGGGGAGGKGIVIVRYAVWTENVPAVASASVEVNGPSFATVSAKLASVGVGSSAATVMFKCWKASAPDDTTEKEIGEVDGSAAVLVTEKLLGGFAADTEYGYEVWAENDSGSSAKVTGSFRTFSSSAAVTGGTVTESGIRAIHTFTEDGSLVVAHDTLVNVLVVGGGGAGGQGSNGGGGGGGQVIYRENVLLAAGTYPVVIGAGGQPYDVETGKSWSQTASITTTALADATKAYGGTTTFADFTAYGGGMGGTGGGWSMTIGAPYFNAASGGGGSGGLGNTTTGGGPTYFGAGYKGGGGAGNYEPGGGGGGAGGIGGSGSSSKGGDGGAGFSCAISGTPQYYGAGGGGAGTSATNFGLGGSGVGGNGAHSKATGETDAEARNGKDAVANTGSGGGGGMGSGSVGASSYFGGFGADGVVVVSYVDYSKITQGAPTLEDPIVSGTTADSIAFSLNVVDAGGGDGTVALTFKYGATEETLDHAIPFATGVIGNANYEISGLPANGTIYFKVVADNGEKDGTAETAVCSAQTKKLITKELVLNKNGSVTYELDGATTAKQSIVVLVDGEELAAYDSDANPELFTKGAHDAVPVYAAEQYGANHSFVVRYVATLDDVDFVNESAVLSADLQDDTTYTWKAAVVDGDWTESANWTATNPKRGFPTTGSTVKFPNCTCTVRVDRVISTGTMTFTANGKYVFVGEGDGIVLNCNGSGDSPFAASDYTFDNLKYSISVGQNGFLGKPKTLALLNGAEFVVANGKEFTMYSGAVEVRDGSILRTTGGVGGNGDATYLVNGGTIIAGSFNFGQRGSATSYTKELRIRGAASQVQCGGNFYAQNGVGTVNLELTSGEYANALIKETGTTEMCTSGGIVTFNVEALPETKQMPKCEILVADWSKKNIKVANVAFGTKARKSDYFYFTETDAADAPRYMSAEEAAGKAIKYIWYHHEPSNGMMLIVW